MTAKLGEKWIKASIAGTIWAASEIVLGSFLHNLRVPFSGNILTAIGLIILISISYKWTERGLFWRAGLICALLKTMSPSAVIFGPMIAIFAESALLEISTRLLGRTILGYLLGAMLAMSWNLFQKIMNYIIFYGESIVEVYSDLLKMAQKQLNIQTEIVWMPIFILLVVYAAFGLFAGVMGIRVGRKIRESPTEETARLQNNRNNRVPAGRSREFDYSVLWLILNFVLTIGAFYLLSKTHWIIWSIAVAALIVVWSFRYKRALRQISKPGFWIFFVIITALTAFVFTNAKSGENLLEQGLITGLQMNFRAALIIVGFSVIGTELYNPAVRNFFIRTSMKNLPLALELAAESLPSFVSHIPSFKNLTKNPVSVFRLVIAEAENRLNEIRDKSEIINNIYIITGTKSEGKTTFLKALAEELRKKNIKTGGIICERIMIEGNTIGYDVINIESGEKEPFLRLGGNCGTESIGRFTICPDGLAFGKNVLNSINLPECRIVIIDEVGMLEISGRGWAGSLTDLLSNPGCHILISVRDIFIDEVKKKFNLGPAEVLRVSENDPLETSSALVKKLEPAGITGQNGT